MTMRITFRQLRAFVTTAHLNSFVDADKNWDNAVVEQEFLEILQVNDTVVGVVDIERFIESEKLFL